jgi:uncharacterized membrane protein YfcA
MEFIAIYVLLGLCSGFFAGLLGIGGGVITVPALYYILLWKGASAGGVMQTAIATSLASTMVATALSTLAHRRRGAIYYNVLGFLVPGLIIGCISGAQLVSLLPGDLLRIIFGCVILVIGIYFVIPNLQIPQIANRPNPLLFFFGLVIGHLSSFLGVGGGIFTVPLFYAFHIPSSNIAATSSAVTFTTTLTGTLTYLFMAWGAGPTSSTFGYIDPLAFLCISLGSFLSIRLGVKLAHHLPAPTVKRIFGGILGVTGIVMVFSPI